MSSSTKTSVVDFEIRDVSGQKMAKVKACPADASVAEVIPSVLAMMDLPQNDLEGNALVHTLRRDRDGTILHAGDVVGDVIESGERCVLQPSVDAGGK